MTQNKDNRPTSPHLQIYAWSIASFTSIIHRLTGVLLYLSIVAISWYIVLFTYKTGMAGAFNPADINAMQESCNCPLMNTLQYAACAAGVFIIFALYYHFCNGIRHLFWGIGKGYEIKLAKNTGILVILAAILLTAVTIGLVAYFKFM